jgi:hypothetical protein
MSRKELSGPYRLTFESIDCAVARHSPGVYALGHVGGDGRFYTHHVGRADSDLRHRLRNHIGAAMMFKYRYAPSSREAFEGECALFHDLGPPGNRVHPDRPKGTSWTCPRCQIFVVKA